MRAEEHLDKHSSSSSIVPARHIYVRSDFISTNSSANSPHPYILYKQRSWPEMRIDYTVNATAPFGKTTNGLSQHWAKLPNHGTSRNRPIAGRARSTAGTGNDVKRHSVIHLGGPDIDCEPARAHFTRPHRQIVLSVLRSKSVHVGDSPQELSTNTPPERTPTPA